MLCFGDWRILFMDYETKAFMDFKGGLITSFFYTFLRAFLKRPFFVGIIF